MIADNNQQKSLSEVVDILISSGETPEAYMRRVWPRAEGQDYEAIISPVKRALKRRLHKERPLAILRWLMIVPVVLLAGLCLNVIFVFGFSVPEFPADFWVRRDMQGAWILGTAALLDKGVISGGAVVAIPFFWHRVGKSLRPR